MSKERDLLARAGLVIAQHRWSHPHDPVLRKLSHQINAYFEEPEVNLEALSLTEPLYIHPPHPFVRLTDEEIKMLTDSSVSPDWTDEFELYHFARSVEDALEEKNNAF